MRNSSTPTNAPQIWACHSDPQRTHMISLYKTIAPATARGRCSMHRIEGTSPRAAVWIASSWQIPTRSHRIAVPHRLGSARALPPEGRLPLQIHDRCRGLTFYTRHTPNQALWPWAIMRICGLQWEAMHPSSVKSRRSTCT